MQATYNDQTFTHNVQNLTYTLQKVAKFVISIINQSNDLYLFVEASWKNHNRF